MEITYKLEEKDLLDFQLFTASTSQRIAKKKRNGHILVTISFLFLGIYFYLANNTPMSIYFVVISIVFGVFYPKYFNWRYKKHYKDHVKETYQKLFGEEVKLNFTEDYIYSEDKTGQGKIKLHEVEDVNETPNHFFLNISTRVTLIIPKRELDDIDSLRAILKAIGLKVNDQLDWKWK